MDIQEGGAVSRPVSNGLSGKVVVPGDKSISHRALMLGAIAEGKTQIRGLLEGDDVLRTAAAMRALGADIERNSANDVDSWEVIGGFGDQKLASEPCLYFGNAGTGVRLAMGLVAGLGEAATFDGDSSLRSRPMGRIIEPLVEMGAITQSNDGQLPVSFSANQSLNGIRYRLPVPSAQIKSAILFAGLRAKGSTIIEEPLRSRDHTENMLLAFGADLDIEDGPDGRIIKLPGEQSLQGTFVDVPGDPSSAAFLMAAALIVPGSDITIKNIMMNPMRTGIFTTFQEMGGLLEVRNQHDQGGENVADITVRYSKLKGVNVPPERASSMIDEYPVLSVLAAFAEGETVMNGIGEMRVKESDRIAACEAGLRANGVEVESGKDWLKVVGSGATPKGGAKVATYHDHRIAMSFLIMGLHTQNPVAVDDVSMIMTSFPGFAELMNGLGARIE